MCRIVTVSNSEIPKKTQAGKNILHINKSHQITTLIPSELIYNTHRLVTGRGGREGKFYHYSLGFLNLFQLTHSAMRIRQEKRMHYPRWFGVFIELLVPPHAWKGPITIHILLPSWLLLIDIPVLPRVSDYWSSTVTYRLHPPGFFHLKTTRAIKPWYHRAEFTSSVQQHMQRCINCQTSFLADWPHCACWSMCFLVQVFFLKCLLEGEPLIFMYLIISMMSETARSYQFLPIFPVTSKAAKTFALMLSWNMILLCSLIQLENWCRSIKKACIWRIFWENTFPRLSSAAINYILNKA